MAAQMNEDTNERLLFLCLPCRGAIVKWWEWTGMVKERISRALASSPCLKLFSTESPTLGSYEDDKVGDTVPIRCTHRFVEIPVGD